MCFSAAASFGIGTVLTAAGIASVKKVKSPYELAFAGIPLIFATQQFSEGFVWLGLTNIEHEHYLKTAISAFIFFAWVVWPSWVPLAFALIEPSPQKKKILNICFCIGLIVSSYLAYHLLMFHTIAEIYNHHIHYDMPELDFIRIGEILYATATILPPLFSSVKGSMLLGALILSSLIISKFFFKDNVISVWCFFAAAISIMIVYIMRKKHPGFKSRGAIL